MSRADSKFQRWVFSIKPASWPKLLVPTTLGAALGIGASESVFLPGLGFAFFFTICLGLFIVWMNDWADISVDQIKRRMFPDGSHKTIPDGYLNARKVFFAGLSAGFLGVILSFWASTQLGRPLLGWAALGCLGIFVAYSLPPIKLNYRGGGEVLEALGVGIALPSYATYALSGLFWTAESSVLFGWTLLSLTSALASGISDEESDRKGGKRTAVTTFGNSTVRAVIEWSVPIVILAWIWVALAGVLPFWAVLAPSAAVFYHWLKLRKSSPAALTNAFDAQRTYKHDLHNAIWAGGLVLAAALLLARSL